MRLVLLGPPGAGKGTQAALLPAKLGVPHISTGDLFRANISQGTAVGVEAKKYLDAGNLVPSEITVDMVRARVAEPDAAKGFILDGFPRSTEQADALTVRRNASPSAVILDEDGSAGRLYDAKTTPHMFVIDPEGALVYAGGIDTSDYVEQLMPLLRAAVAPLPRCAGDCSSSRSSKSW